MDCRVCTTYLIMITTVESARGRARYKIVSPIQRYSKVSPVPIQTELHHSQVTSSCRPSSLQNLYLLHHFSASCRKRRNICQGPSSLAIKEASLHAASD